MRQATMICAFVAVFGSWTLVASEPTVVHDRHSVELTRVLTAVCPFPVVLHVTGDINSALFFDDAGNLVRLLETVKHVHITYTANGVTLEGRGTGGFNLIFDSDGPREGSTFGINEILTVPGSGWVFLDTGRTEILFDPRPHVLFSAGPREYDVPAFCAALSGQ